MLAATWSLHWKAGIPLMVGMDATKGTTKRVNLSDMFMYDNNAVYNAVVRLREMHCMERHGNYELCAAMTDCEHLDNANTSCLNRFPGVVIIGAFKSGTRELIDFLALNPLVKIKRLPEYEVSYFDRNVGFGPEWYRKQMPSSLGSQTTIEKSPSYLSSKIAPRQIQYVNPGMKLILLVREPVSRTMSHFSFDKYQSSQKYGDSLGRCALQKQWLEHKRPDKKVNKNCFAVKHSLYYENLNNYLEYFDMKQIGVIEADIFAKEPCIVLQQVEQFLGLEPYIKCSDFIYNQAKDFYCVADITGEKTGVCYDHDRGRVNSSDTEESRQLEPILRKFFKPLNEEFFELIGKRFKW